MGQQPIAPPPHPTFVAHKREGGQQRIDRRQEQHHMDQRLGVLEPLECREAGEEKRTPKKKKQWQRNGRGAVNQ